MNILFDFISVCRKNGAGEYNRCVFYNLLSAVESCSSKVNLFVFYSSQLGIGYEDLREENINSRREIRFLDVQKANLNQYVEQYKIDKVFIAACSQYYPNPSVLDSIQCEVVCVFHDLVFEETYNNKVAHFVELNNPDSESKAGLSWKRKLLNLCAHICINKFTVWYYYWGHASRYMLLCNMTQPFIDLYNRKKVKVIAVSQYTKDSLVYNYGFKADDICVLYSPERCYYGVNDKIENQLLDSIIREHKCFYLMVSANIPNKNAYKALMAFKRFSEQNPDKYVVTIGYPKQLYPNHIVLPFLSDSDLFHTYQSCYALIYPSLFEGFGYPPIEAMKFGKPVLCSNTTSMPEVLGDAPLFFSPIYETSIFSILNQLTPEQYERRSRQSFERYRVIHDRQVGDMKKIIDIILKS